MKATFLFFFSILIGLSAIILYPHDQTAERILKDGGPPQALKSWQIILIEGKLEQTQEGVYVLQYVSGAGRSSTKSCLILYGLRRSWPLRLKASFLADWGMLLKVKGKVLPEKAPSYPTPSETRHPRQFCIAALYSHGIDVW